MIVGLQIGPRLVCGVIHTFERDSYRRPISISSSSLPPTLSILPYPPSLHLMFPLFSSRFFLFCFPVFSLPVVKKMYLILIFPVFFSHYFFSLYFSSYNYFPFFFISFLFSVFSRLLMFTLFSASLNVSYFLCFS